MYHITFHIFRKPRGKLNIFIGSTKNIIYSTLFTISLNIFTYSFRIQFFNKKRLIKELNMTKEKVRQFQIDELYGRN